MDHAALDLDFLTVFCDGKHESPCQQKINIREFQRLTCIVHIYLFKWSIIINMLSVTTTNYYSKLRWLLERIAYLPPILGSRSLVWTWLRSHGLFHPCKTWRSYTLMPDPTNTPPGFGKWSSCLIAQCPLLRVKIPLPGSVYTSLVRWTAKIMFVDKWWICGWLMLITYIYIYTHPKSSYGQIRIPKKHADPKGLAGSRGNSALRLCISSVAWSCPAGFLTSWEIPNRWMDSFMENLLKWMIPWFPYFRKLPFVYSIEHFHRFP